MVQSLFPLTSIISNARKATGLLGPKGKLLEVDIFLEDLKLGFEFQVLLFCILSLLWCSLTCFRINTITSTLVMENIRYPSIFTVRNIY
jgi:hypothetical protein